MVKKLMAVSELTYRWPYSVPKNRHKNHRGSVGSCFPSASFAFYCVVYVGQDPRVALILLPHSLGSLVL